LRGAHQVLCIQGFLAARKHAEQILLLAEMMQVTPWVSPKSSLGLCADAPLPQGWNVPCFRGGAKVLQHLRKRFHLGSTEEQCVELVLTLIGDRFANPASLSLL
jgi:phosphatidylinositol 4-kinase